MTELSDGRQWHKTSGRAITIVTGDRSEVLSGQSIEAAGLLGLIPPPMNPGEFDYRAFERVEGVRLRFTIADPQSFWRRTAGRSLWPRELLGRIRSWTRARLFDRLDPSVAPLAAALLLGQREGIEPEVNDAFARTGTTHLLAISGLQLQALAFALLAVFRLVGVARRPAYVSVAIAMIAYAFVVGPAPSVVRATVMTAAFCLASISQRWNRSANTLALAGIGTLAVNPSYLFDVGCQLSFLAIGTLIWIVPPSATLARAGIGKLRDRLLGRVTPLDLLERDFEPAWRLALQRAGVLVLDSVVASAVVFVAALPLVAMRFHLISPIGIFLNLPLIPLTTAALLLGGLGLAASSIWGPLGAPLAWWRSQVPLCHESHCSLGSRPEVGAPFRGWAGMGLGIDLLHSAGSGRYCREGRPFLRAVHFPALAEEHPLLAPRDVGRTGLAVSGCTHAPAPTAEIEFLSVGHGLAVLIRTPDGGAYLYDCGRLGDSSVGRRIVAPALWKRGVGRIDAVLLSHADQDHYDGLLDLLDRFPIGVVRVTPHFGGDANPAANDLLAKIKSRAIPIRPVTAPESWQRAGVSFTIRHPPAGWDPESTDNARSIVLDVAFAGRHILLTGDLELSGLEALVAQPRPDPPPEAILAPHHGGRAANPEWLYEWARPRIVIASQRPPSVPANDPLAAIERMGIPILRTWRKGAIRISWTRDGVVATAFLDQNDDQRPNSRSGDTRA